MNIHIDEHIKRMIERSSEAKEMFLACSLKMMGEKHINKKTVSKYRLVMSIEKCSFGELKIMYTVEYIGKKR